MEGAIRTQAWARSQMKKKTICVNINFVESRKAAKAFAQKNRVGAVIPLNQIREQTDAMVTPHPKYLLYVFII